MISPHIFLSKIRRNWRDFRQNEQGSQSIEAVLMVPMLLFTITFTYVYYSAFSAKGQANKAAYTLSDYISRQTDAIDQTFIDGLSDTYGFLTNDPDVSLRASAVYWSEDENSTNGGDHSIIWSASTGSFSPYTTANLSSIQNRIPVMYNGQEVIVIETLRTWAPLLDVGLGLRDFNDFVVTSPRFATQVIFNDGTEIISIETEESDDPN